MVYFSCSGCNESLKKNKVANHLSFCRRCAFLTCLDCQKDFDAESYTKHNQCISEVERYGGPGYVLPGNANKGQKKQMGWMDSVLLNIDAFLEETKNMKHKKNEQIVMTGLQRYDNIPRKKAKFVNFIKSSFARFRYNEPLIEAVWNVISVIKTEEDKAKPSSEEPAPKGQPVINGQEAKEEANSKKKKGSKDEVDEDAIDSSKMNGDSGDKKRRKKKKRKHEEEEREDAIEEQEVDEEINSKGKKKKKKKRKMEAEEEEEESRKKKRKREDDVDEGMDETNQESEVEEGEAEEDDDSKTADDGKENESETSVNEGAVEEGAIESDMMNGDGGNKKKKKRKRQEEEKDEVEEETESRKKKKKKRKMEAEEAEDVGDSEANETADFDADETSPDTKTAGDDKENESETSVNEGRAEAKEKKRKKKKKRGRKERDSEDNIEETEEVSPPVKRLKKAYVPEGFQQQRLNETLEPETPKKFVISDVVTTILEDKGEGGIPMKKLEKKVLSEYQVSLKEGQPSRPHKICSKLKTIVSKHFRLVNDRVFLRPEV